MQAPQISPTMGYSNTLVLVNPYNHVKLPIKQKEHPKDIKRITKDIVSSITVSPLIIHAEHLPASLISRTFSSPSGCPEPVKNHYREETRCVR